MIDSIPNDTLDPGDCCPKCGGAEIEFLSMAVRHHLVFKCFSEECGYMWKTSLYLEEDEEEETSL